GADALAAHGVDVFLVLQQNAERLVDDVLIEHVAIESHQRRRPIERFGNAGRLVEIRRAQILDEGGDLPGEPLRGAGHFCPDDAIFLLEVGIRNPAVDAAALQRVMHLARAVRRDHHDRRLGGADGAELGDGHLKVRQELQQVALELLIRAIDFVDEQNRRPLTCLFNRAQQGPFDEKRLGEELVRRDGAIEIARNLNHADFEQLPRVVPLVHSLADVEAFVTLETDERGIERGGKHLRNFCLADTGFAFEKQRPFQAQRQIDGDGECPLRDVLLSTKGLLQRVDRRRNRQRRVAHARPARAAAAAIARLTYTGATALRYEADAKMSPLTSPPRSAPTCPAAAAIVAASSPLPTSAFSTAAARHACDTRPPSATRAAEHWLFASVSDAATPM